MPLILPGNVGSATAATGFNVDNSARFTKASSDYLNRTHGASGSTRKMTISFWIKKSVSKDHGQADGMMILGGQQDSYPGFHLTFLSSNDTLIFRDARAANDVKFDVRSDAKFRDLSAWSHIVYALDTTQGTASNRIKLYINGTQISDLAGSTASGAGSGDPLYPDENLDTIFNGNEAHFINKYASNYEDFYLSEYCFIDGSQLAADQFGEFDSDSGIWKPIDVSGLTFGTNGFYLDFEDSSALGNDAAGSNNWTSNNFAAINQTTDTCTNNFATMNPLDNYFAGSTFSEGNCKIVTTGGNITYNTSTMGFSSGKWYMEVKLGSSSGEVLGVIRGVSTGNNNDNKIGNRSDGFGYDYRGLVEGNGADLGGTFAAFDSGDVIGVYADLDNNELYFSKNGTLQNSGTGLTLPAGTYFFAVGDNHGSNAATLEVNFGNPISALDNTAITDDNGHGAFEYSPNITGDSVAKKFYALNTKNLAEFG